MVSSSLKQWHWVTAVVVLAVAGFFGYRAAVVTAETPPKPSPPASVVPDSGFTTTALADSSIAYQGRLVDSGGSPVNGLKTLTFRLYDASSGGFLLGSSSQTVTVSDGVFNANIAVPQWAFNGRALWLEVQVSGDPSPMTPRQKIQAVPYALGLVPGASVSTDQGWAALKGYSYGSRDWGGIGVYGYSSTGTAGVYGYGSSTTGVMGGSYDDYGVYGYSTNGFAGVGGFNSGGYGVSGQTNNGSGVYGRASSGFAGVYGYGDGGSAAGVYGKGNVGYGGYFYSDYYRGLYASSNPNYYAGYFANRGGSSRPGLYVDGSLFVSGSKSGYVVDLASNEGPQPLETGDVVIIVGAGTPVVGEIPVVKVRKAAEAESASVAGVVDQPFVLQTPTRADDHAIPAPSGPTARIADNTSIGDGDYLTIVTLGSFKAINVDATYGAIQPGDLLVTSPRDGYAMKATNPAAGTIVGKALGSLASGTGQIPVIVTLQ
ncbi:MAG: hypothetical protein HYY30_10880 [Chloroflexi bacterium]|nr:hypothetical protein [Chloroflexota bacterium]